MSGTNFPFQFNVLRKKFFWTGYWLFTVLIARAQMSGNPLADYPGASAFSIQHADIGSCTINPASLAQLKQTAIGLYAQRPFLLKEMNEYTAMAGIVTAPGNFAGSICYGGYAGYNETHVQLAYGRKLGTKLDIGVQACYHRFQISNGYGAASTLTMKVGTVLHISDKLHTGFIVDNPLPNRFGQIKDEKLPTIILAGIGYEPSSKFLFSVKLQKEENHPVSINPVVQYNPVRRILIRAGIQPETNSSWLGAGFIFKQYRLDIAAAYHQQLGVTPGLMLIINFEPANDQTLLLSK